MTKILVIDDEELMRKLMKKMLMRDGHDVFIARDGVDGVEQFHQINPDLVITDMVMPNKDGYESLKSCLRPMLNCQSLQCLVVDDWLLMVLIRLKSLAQKEFCKNLLHSNNCER